MAELNRGIASVGVGPPLSFSPFGSSCGSVVVTTPGQAPNDPDPLFIIRLPTPDLFTVLPANTHSSVAPLLAVIVLLATIVF